MTEYNLHRCGYCGHPTDENGIPIIYHEAELSLYDEHAVMVAGRCCEDEIRQRHALEQEILSYEDESHGV